MKKSKKGLAWSALLAVLSLACNLGGKYAASQLSLPLWLDSLGTMLSAYCLGPIPGAAVGFLTNLIWCWSDPMQWTYGIVSIVIGVLIGLLSRRGAFTDISRALNAGALLAAAAAVISVPLNFLFYDGAVGNIWGDGVIGFLQDQGVPKIIGCFVGEFYIDFVDKMLVCLLLFAILKFRDRISWHPLRRTSAAALAFVLLLPFLADPITAEAADDVSYDYSSYVQTVYDASNGLPCGKTNYIAQTPDGTLWIACYDGLYSYDGTDFTLKSEYESVKNVNCLYVDDQGRLLIGTNDDGLSISVNDVVTNVFDSSNGSPTDTIRSITQASDGYYYVGTSDAMMVIRFNNDEPEIVGTLTDVTSSIKGGTGASDQNGHAAAVTAMGDIYLLSGGEVVDVISKTDDASFMSAAFDDSGMLLAGTTNNKVLVYDISSGEAKLTKTLSVGNLTSVDGIFPKSDGRVFVCADSGVGFFDSDDVFHPINTNSFNNSFEAMLIDYQGNLWFTSSRFGLLRLATSSFADLYSEIGMESAVVNTNCFWRGNLYVGTDNGLDIISGDLTCELSSFLTEELDGTRIRCLMTDSDDNLWICTYGRGLFCVSGDDKDSITVYDSDNGFLGNRVRLVTQLSDGTIAASSTAGLTFIKDGQIIAVTSYEDGFDSTPALTLTELSDGTLLAGTDGAGLVVVEDYKAVRTLKKEDGLTSTVILRIVADSQGDGAFLVTSNGISYITNSLEVRSLEHFPYSNNYDLVQTEDGTIFVPSSAGVYVLNYEELLADEGELSYELLDSRRGLTTNLTANSWNCIDDDNNLYLSCGTGTFKVNLDDYHSAVTSYRMKIGSAELDGTGVKVTEGENLSVARDVKSITLHPVIFNFSVEDPHVSYYLEGFETTAHVMAQSELESVTYTNLSPGTYVFHLSVLDDTQTQTLNQIDCTIVKEKAIQDNQWFILYLILVMIAFVAWLTWALVHGRMDRKLKMVRRQLEMGNETIMAIAHTVDAKDSNTAHHSFRVSEYSALIGKRYGMSDEECENLRKAALLHDIGKIAIPDSVLNKPGRLTDEEYVIMKSHVDHGAEILKDFTLIEHASEGAQYHHERYDGRGYTHGLKGEEIPLYARIIGIADAFDAMTANRVYRKKMDFDYVLGELRKGRGTQFDPNLLDIFLQLIEEKVIDVDALYKEPAEAESEKKPPETNT